MTNFEYIIVMISVRIEDYRIIQLTRTFIFYRNIDMPQLIFVKYARRYGDFRKKKLYFIIIDAFFIGKRKPSVIKLNEINEWIKLRCRVCGSLLVPMYSLCLISPHRVQFLSNKNHFKSCNFLSSIIKSIIKYRLSKFVR